MLTGSKILPSRPRRWPEGSIVYQIYPRSFYDSNNDGIGDIPGITKKLGYLKDLGINVIWLSPFYPSPMADFGYDIADYCEVDPIFGSMRDMDRLIKSAHRKGIKILADLVPNHSSDEHEWFRQSRQSKENKYADWYIWHDAKGMDRSGKPIPPNNWLSIFSGESAWEWEPARQQFYLHSFDVRQPDLNWPNPEVREAFKDVMRFWLDRGVDGFRVDAVRFMAKDPIFKDNPLNPDYKTGDRNTYGSLIHSNSQGWPQLYSYLNEMASVLKEEPYKKRLRFMVTESYPEEPVEEYLAYYQGVDPEVAAPFNFEGLSLPWRAKPWQEFLGQFHAALDAYSPLCVASYAFGNHDQHRLVTRLGEDRARSAAVLLLTLPGMAFIYNGEEIGMVNGKIPPALVQDPAAMDGPGRDPERTPMQWSDAKNAGFSEAHTPWLPIADGYQQRNVKSQKNDPQSFLTLYRKLAKIRHKSRPLRHGSFELVDTGHESVLGFMRKHDGDYTVTLLNFSDRQVTITLPDSVPVSKIVVCSDPRAKHKPIKHNTIHLLGDEAVLLRGR
jgi:alpha-glucosidase